MGKRYGRHQRRAHRAEIAQLREAYERERVLSAHVLQKLHKLEQQVADWDDDVRGLLGSYSAFRPNTPRLQADYPFERISVGSSVVELKRLAIRSKTDLQNLRQVVRLIVERPNGGEELHVAYDIDGSFLMMMGKRDLWLIARQIAQQFYEHGNRRGV